MKEGNLEIYFYFNPAMEKMMIDFQSFSKLAISLSGLLEPVLAPVGRMWGKPWTDCQSVAGQTIASK